MFWGIRVVMDRTGGSGGMTYFVCFLSWWHELRQAMTTWSAYCLCLWWTSWQEMTVLKWRLAGSCVKPQDSVSISCVYWHVHLVYVEYPCIYHDPTQLTTFSALKLEVRIRCSKHMLLVPFIIENILQGVILSSIFHTSKSHPHVSLKSHPHVATCNFCQAL